MSKSNVSDEQCREWRAAYRSGLSPYEVAVENDVDRGEVYTHLAGECSHSSRDAPVSSSRGHDVSDAECNEMREAYHSGGEMQELEESTGRRWGTIVRHLTGECDHSDDSGLTVERAEILERDHVSPETCAEFRRGCRDASSVMAYAETVEYQYQLVLAHVNGDCDHDIDVPPREPNDRREDVSRETCQSIRESYRAGPEVEFEELAEEYDCSPGTAEQHVTFRCSHPPVDTLVTEVEAVEDLLDDSVQIRIEK